MILFQGYADIICGIMQTFLYNLLIISVDFRNYGKRYRDAMLQAKTYISVQYINQWLIDGKRQSGYCVMRKLSPWVKRRMRFVGSRVKKERDDVVWGITKLTIMIIRRLIPGGSEAVL